MTRLFMLALGVALGLGGTAHAQSNTATSTNANTSAQTSGNDMAKHHVRHHASAKDTHHAMDHHAMDRGETAYRSALRQCVQGPSNERDRCLDQAIAQHQRG